MYVVGFLGFDSHLAKAMNRSIKCPPLLLVDSPDVWISSTLTASSIGQPTSSFQTNEHIATILDGKTIAEEMKSRMAGEILEMKKAIGMTPGLGIILVGKREDSQVLVHAKVKACKEVGIASVVAQLSEDCNEDEVCDAVSRMNEDESVHGITVQLPLPKHINEEKILKCVSVQKDVDGFHPLNVGDLAMRGREPLFIACAAKACLEMLLSYGFELKGAKCVVIGRSKMGLPTSLLLQRHHATVSVVHAFTQNPEQLTSEADIVVSDVGVPNIVRGHWLKPGAVVIDMGSISIKDDTSVNSHSLVGDVCYEEAIGKVSAITPVPGGIGPVTFSMLLSNTLDSAKRVYNYT